MLQRAFDDFVLRRASIDDQTLLVFANAQGRAGNRLFESAGYVGRRHPLQRVDHHRTGQLRRFGHDLIQQVLDHLVVLGTSPGDQLRVVGTEGQVGDGNRFPDKPISIGNSSGIHAFQRIEKDLGCRHGRFLHVDFLQDRGDLLVVGRRGKDG